MRDYNECKGSDIRQKLNNEKNMPEVNVENGAELCIIKEIETIDQLIQKCVTKDGSYDIKKMECLERH